MIQFSKDYSNINRSFRRKVVFRVGLEAGFFSEYNNMILAIAWCLRNKLQFQLYSTNANFGFNMGWADYFIPFCDEVFDGFHLKYNHRPLPYGKNKYYPLLLRAMFKFSLLKTKFDYTPPFHRLQKKLGIGKLLTQDIFALARAQSTTEDIEIPELEFKGNLRSLCNLITDITWRFNQGTQMLINETIRDLNLPDKYIGFHIREGDKLVEYPKMHASSYIKEAETISDLRTAFVLTDDFRIINELRESCPSWHFYTLCQPHERGYYHTAFIQLNIKEKKDRHVRLFSSMQVLEQSSHFVGTFSSNPGMFLGMRMLPENCHGIDYNEWRIW